MEIPRLSIYVGMPSHSLLQLPDRLPGVLPDIRQNVTTGKWPTDPKFYNYTLDVRFPFSWALSYMVSVIFLNQVNRRRQNKPWAVSKFRAFKTFVLAHNVFLALLSAWVLLSACKVILGQAPAPGEDNYLVHVVDRLCRTEELMEIERLGHHSSWNNDLTHVHEVWYIAWIFYLLKFYEVLDTAIILASGKEASLLQTYHHTGVMICAWASLRFVAPSAFSVLLLNSGIHTVMYTYYALTVLRVRLPVVIKRTLTSMQMVQFVLGLSTGFCYLFIKYDIPMPNRIDYQISPLESANFQYGKAYQTISCLSNPGQAFVFWLGAVYVIPLMYLFAQFYSQAYRTPVKIKSL